MANLSIQLDCLDEGLIGCLVDGKFGCEEGIRHSPRFRWLVWGGDVNFNAYPSAGFDSGYANWPAVESRRRL